MAEIYAFANHKGGVGKTTSVVNIGAGLALRGYSVLLIDLDAQQNLTFSLLGEEEQRESIFDALTGRAALPVLNVKEGMDIVPASIDLARAEYDLADTDLRETLLARLLEGVADRYDFILLDCPPSLGLATTNAMAAATKLYIPLTAEVLPFTGLSTLEEVTEVIAKATGGGATIGGVFITRYSRRRLSDAIAGEIEARFGDRVFKTKIRENIALAEAPLTRSDIFAYAPRSNGARDYAALVEEILARSGRTDTKSK